LFADRFGFVFLLEASEASAIKRLVALHHRLSERIGVVEHMAGLQVGGAKLPLRLTFDVEGADLNDPARMAGRALRGKEMFRLRCGGSPGPRAPLRRALTNPPPAAGLTSPSTPSRPHRPNRPCSTPILIYSTQSEAWQ
jgi:hypothetical protein